MSDNVTPIGNRATRRSWNQYVASAKARTFELELSGPEDIVIVTSPTTEQLEEMAREQRAGSIPGAYRAIMGLENANRTLDYAAKVAADAGDPGVYALSLREMLRDLMSGLGLGGPGES